MTHRERPGRSMGWREGGVINVPGMQIRLDEGELLLPLLVGRMDMDHEYMATNLLRSQLDANGVFWTDVKHLGKRSTCWKMKEDGPYWYADQLGGQEKLFIFCQTFYPDRALADLGMKETS